MITVVDKLLVIGFHRFQDVPSTDNTKQDALLYYRKVAKIMARKNGNDRKQLRIRGNTNRVRSHNGFSALCRTGIAEKYSVENQLTQRRPAAS